MKISSVLSFLLLVCGFQPFRSSALHIEDVEITGEVELIGDSFLSQGEAKGSSQANVDSSFVSFVQARARGENTGLFGFFRFNSQKKYLLPVTSVFHTTEKHVDYDAHSNYQAQAEGVVALYSLQDHKEAHFEVEETCIPIQKNRLMLFHGGDSVHRTVIRNTEENAVKFIGPFATKTLSIVGAVSLSPTEYPTSNPTKSPPLTPTASPTTSPISSTTTSPTANTTASLTSSPTASPTTKSGKTLKSGKGPKSGKTPKSGKKIQLF